MARAKVRFHSSEISGVLPEFYQSDYPRLIEFLENYYEYTKEDPSGSFEAKIQDLFSIRDISTTTLDALDLLLRGIGNGIDTSAFPDEATARLSTKLLANFYRAKGTQMSVEQFFKAFFHQDVEVVYPKQYIFKIGEADSQIGPESVKFITDDRRFQVFSVLLKVGMSTSDFKEFYKKFVHPAGFYLATQVSTLGLADIETESGKQTDPLETPYLFLESEAENKIKPMYALLTMRETDPVDETFILSSAETLGRYKNMSLQRIEDIYDTLAYWASPAAPRMDATDLHMGDDIEFMDAQETEVTIDVSLVPPSPGRMQPMPEGNPEVYSVADYTVFYGDLVIEGIKLGGVEISSIEYVGDQVIVGNEQ